MEIPAPHVPAASARVAMALQAAERASDLLRRRHVLQGRFYLSQVASDLAKGADYLKAAGAQYAGKSEFLAKLSTWYQDEARKVHGPGNAPAIADEVFAQQGLLFVADPAR